MKCSMAKSKEYNRIKNMGLKTVCKSADECEEDEQMNLSSCTLVVVDSCEGEWGGCDCG